MTIIPAPYRVLAAALAGVLVLAGAYMAGRTHGKAAVQLRWDAAVSQQRAAALEAERTARAEEARRIGAVTEVANAYADRLRASRAAADAARRDADGLRDAIAAVNGRPSVDTTSGACPDGAGRSQVMGDLLAECGRLLSVGQVEGRRLADQLQALQQYVGSVLVAP